MASTETGHWDTIVAGPSKWELMIALFHQNPRSEPSLVIFTVAKSGKIVAVIKSVDREDGSYES